MVHLFENIHFALQSLNFVGVVNLFLFDKLSCSFDAADFGHHVHHDAEATFAKFLLYLIILIKVPFLLFYKGYLRNL